MDAKVYKISDSGPRCITRKYKKMDKMYRICNNKKNLNNNRRI